MKKIINTIGVFAILGLIGLTGCSSDDKDNQVTGIELQMDTAYIILPTVGDTYTVVTNLIPENASNKNEYQDVRIKSSDGKIIKVNEQGLLEAVSGGIVTISVVPYNHPMHIRTFTAKVPIHIEKIEVIAANKKQRVLVGDKLDLRTKITYTPEGTTEKNLTGVADKEGIVSIDKNGVIIGEKAGTTNITVTSQDNPEQTAVITVEVVYTDIERKGWVITTSHTSPNDSGKSKIEYLTDGKNNTFMALVKPGKSYDEVTVPIADIVSFTIDRGEQKEHIDGFRIIHASGTLGLRVWEVSFYGTDDLANEFIEIAKQIVIPGAETVSAVESPMIVLPKTNYRYIKMTYDRWNKTANSTMQISEFYLCSSPETGGK